MQQSPSTQRPRDVVEALTTPPTRCPRAGPGTTIRKKSVGLGDLPRPSEASFGDRAPWAVITTRTLTTSLGIDRGNWATWRCRGICPAELPPAWFRPASGAPCYYRIDTVLGWLASRHGEPFDTGAAHRDYLRQIHMPPHLVWVRRLAEREGPAQGEVKFTPTGFAAYLASLEGIA